MSQSKKRAVFFLTMLAAGSIVILVYLAMTGNAPQKYTDIVIEFTSVFSSNKSAERSLVYLLVFAGAGIYTLYFMYTLKTKKGLPEPEDTQAGTDRGGVQEYAGTAVCLLAALAGLYYLVFAQVNPILFGALLVMLAAAAVDRTLIVHGLVFYYVGIYAMCGLYRVYVSAGGTRGITSMQLAVFMMIITAFLLLFRSRKRLLFLGCLAGQLFVPGVLLIYVSDRYLYHGEGKEVPVPGAVKILTAVLVVSFLAEAACRLWKNRKACADIEQAIGFGTCVCIMAFQRFDGAGAVLPADMHHPFENIIGYQQIVELGQKPFAEYIPVSGMYSVVQGAFFQLFGKGEMGHYAVAQNVFYLFAVLLVVWLLRVQVSSICVFLVSLVFYMRSYNRDMFVLPVMLLLIYPKLVERKNLWLKAWFLTSLFHGLYYPVYGAAVGVAFLPLGVWQAVRYGRSGQLKRDAGTARFWAGWAVCLFAAVCCIPYLAGTYRHMRAMAGQTVYANGIARFGQLVPEWFFPYLGDFQVVRIALYDVATFLVPVVFVWAAYALALRIGWVQKDLRGAAAAVSMAILLTVSFSYTFVRLDINNICARSIDSLLAVMVVLMVILEQYLHKKKIGFLVLCLAMLAPAVSARIGFFALDAGLKAYVAVPEDYVFVEQDAVERLGACFIKESLYEQVSSVCASLEEEEKGQAYLGVPGDFGYFYLSGVKGNGVMETFDTLKGYEAVQEAVAAARGQKAAVGNVSPFYNYYLYHWLLTSGEYVWSAEKGCFLPDSGGWTKEQVLEMHRGLSFGMEGFDAGKNAGSFGLSMDSLQGIFSEPDIGFLYRQEGEEGHIAFTDAVDGEEADFMYVEFSDMGQDFVYTLFDLNGEQERSGGLLAKYLMKKNYCPGMQVAVSWEDGEGQEHSMHCAMQQGKLLVPLGAGEKWLLHPHTDLRISVTRDGQQSEVPKIAELRFLKLREAG